MTEAKRRLVDIPSLDGLRAISIMIVFVSHAGFSSVPGGLGVSIFFVISGFLITTLLRIEADTYGHISLREFYIRRAFRILPIFYVVLCLGLLALAAGVLPGATADAGPTSSQFLHYFNFYAITHSGYDIVPGTGVYWSLAIEEHFYVVFPVLVVLLYRFGFSHLRQGVILLVGCALVLAWRLFLVYEQHVGIIRTYYGTDTRLDGLLFGCAAALIAHPVLDRRRDSNGDRQPSPLATWPFGLAGLIAILATLLFRDDGFRESTRYTIQSIAIVACLRYAIAADLRSPVSRVLNARPIAWFGRMSYGFYLVHQIVISGLEEHVHSRIGVIAITFVLSTAAAWALHVVVERPVGRVRARVLKARTPRVALASPAGSG
jgi:peptidoglycan/LPS O-acetylase OafA/YrhL